MQVNIKRCHKDAVIPHKATELAGGWDLVVTEIEQVSDDFVICKLGWAMQPPDNYKITLVPRSSLTKTKWVIQNSPGLGDPDFINEYQLRFRAFPLGLEDKVDSNVNPGDRYIGLVYPEFPYKVGDRIGQMYLEEIIPIEFVEVDELIEYDRKGGYGTTGN